jgi:uncharacterized Zn-finger protein
LGEDAETLQKSMKALRSAEAPANKRKVDAETKWNRNKKKKEAKTNQCHVCNKLLTTRQKLRCHIEAVHEKIKRFACDKCPKKFYYKQEVLIHLKSHQRKYRVDGTSISKTTQCHVCNKLFATRQVLRCHIEAVHEKIKRFACDKCPKKFYQKGGVLEHLKSHPVNYRIVRTDDASRPFKCNFENCGKYFMLNSHLVQHYRSAHSGKIFALHKLTDLKKINFRCSSLHLQVRKVIQNEAPPHGTSTAISTLSSWSLRY